jgi:hypothetical protein
LTAFTTSATITTAAITALAWGKWWLYGFLLSFNCLAAFAWQYIAFINPHFDAYDAKGGMRFCQSIIDICAQGVQGYLALDLFFGAGDFRSTEAATTDNFDAFGVRPHRFLYCLLHSAAKRYTFLQLFRHTAPNQIGVQFRLANLQDIQAHALLGFCFEHGTKSINLFAAFADDDTGFGSMNSHRDLICRSTLNLNS